MVVLIVSDIFGVCESTDKLCTLLLRESHTVHLVDPFHGARLSFNDEQEAHSHFIKYCGHEAYFTVGYQALMKYDPEVVIGFSAGANVVWRMCEFAQANDKNFICFYPTRIHLYLTLEPKASVDVVFPAYETSFDVGNIQKIIDGKNKVTNIATDFCHGFMNNRSSAFQQVAEDFGFELIENKIISDVVSQ